MEIPYTYHLFLPLVITNRAYPPHPNSRRRNLNNMGTKVHICNPSTQEAEADESLV
jgi:hypothetical protein